MVARGGGLEVSGHTFYTNNPSSNPAGHLNFLYEKTKINEKEAGVAPPNKSNLYGCITSAILKHKNLSLDFSRSGQMICCKPGDFQILVPTRARTINFSQSEKGEAFLRQNFRLRFLKNSGQYYRVKT